MLAILAWIHLVVGAIALGALAIGALGCDKTEPQKETKPDAGPPPPTCDSYNRARPDEYKKMDEDSFNSLRHIYGNDDFGRPIAYNWADDVSRLLGAMEPLYKASCQNTDMTKDDKYMEMVGDGFSEHYDRVANDKLNGALVLISIIAPGGEDNKSVVFRGIDALLEKSSDQESFANVLRAAHHFNTALEAYYGPMLKKLEGKEDEFAKLLKEMFNDPTINCKKLGKAKGTVVENLKEVEKYLEKVKKQDLNEKQKEIYEALKAAFESFKVKCGTIPPPPEKDRPQLY